MRKSGVILVILGLLSITACQAQSSPAAAVSPQSSAASASPLVRQDPVLVGYTDPPATIRLLKLDGSVIKTMPGFPVGDEDAIGAFLVMTTETGGAEFTVDATGLTEPVAPAAAKILTPAATGFLLIVDHTTALVGCAVQNDGSCTAEVVNMTTGAVRPLLEVPGTGAASMQMGPSLSLLGISSDLHTAWLRRVTDASGGQADVVGVDLRTGAVKSHPLPPGLIQGQTLAISPDGTMVAGQEEAGTDPDRILVQHLHIANLLTGVDTDVQGKAPYVAGGRPPGILFAPDGGSVAWWGSLNGAFNSGPGQRLNFAATSGAGKTVWLEGTSNFHVTSVSWLDRTTLLAQDEMGTVTIDVGTGAVTTVQASLPYLAAVLV